MELYAVMVMHDYEIDWHSFLGAYTTLEKANDAIAKDEAGSDRPGGTYYDTTKCTLDDGA